MLRCLRKFESIEPPLLGAPGVCDAEGAEPAGEERGVTAPLDSSWGFAFAAAAGVLMLQGSQQALAGTQFMGLQPPADALGDLGDISTGFASVRRTASALNFEAFSFPFSSIFMLTNCIRAIHQVQVVYLSDAILSCPKFNCRLFYSSSSLS